MMDRLVEMIMDVTNYGNSHNMPISEYSSEVVDEINELCTI